MTSRGKLQVLQNLGCRGQKVALLKITHVDMRSSNLLTAMRIKIPRGNSMLKLSASLTARVGSVRVSWEEPRSFKSVTKSLLAPLHILPDTS